MTQEEKQLLLKDICARLPYGVMIYLHTLSEFTGSVIVLNSSIYGFIEDVLNNSSYNIKEIKPYLRSIKSMTEDECNKLFKIINIDESNGDWLKINDIGVIRLFTELGKDFYEIADAMDYLYSIHVDFRNIIEKGLALEAPEGMYKTK